MAQEPLPNTLKPKHQKPNQTLVLLGVQPRLFQDGSVTNDQIVDL